jgi:hypothetical protein
MTNIKNSLVLCLIAFSLASCTNNGPSVGNGVRAADGSWGPGTSVPQVYMVSNGDRLGHYPPYFYPDGPGGGRER